jgi:sugar phosphate permease
MAGSFFLLGLLIHGPDMLIGGIAAVDFGTSKGASTASGLVNGLGSIGAIVGGVLPGVLIDRWGWQGMFSVLAAMAFVATVLLLPKWNALPPTPRSSGATSSPRRS